MHQSAALCGNGLTFSTQSRLLMTPKNKSFENILGKGENAVYQHFLLFPKCFLPFPREICIFFFLVAFILLSACALNSDKSKFLSFGKQFNHYQTTNFRLFQTERVCRRQFQLSRKMA